MILADNVIFSFQQGYLYNATTIENWDGKNRDDDIDLQWNFPGALLYAVTAITTIGSYVLYAPKSESLETNMLTSFLY